MRKYICSILFILACQGQAQLSDFESIDFQKADSLATACKNEKLTNLPKLVHKLTRDLETDVEKFRAIFTWVSISIASDNALFLKQKRKAYRYRKDSLALAQWNDRLHTSLFKKLRKRKKTICTGYAYLVRELAALANIKSTIVNGYGKTGENLDSLEIPNHSWNAVELNGKWYLCDPTWASGYINAETGGFEFDYNDGYFLSPPALFIKNHYPNNPKWALLNTHYPNFEEFIDFPLLYGKAYAHFASIQSPLKMNNTVAKNEKVHFSYRLLQPIEAEEVSFKIDAGLELITVTPKLVDTRNKTLSIEHQFKNRGFYDVHLYIKEDLIATYTFKVKK